MLSSGAFHENMYVEYIMANKKTVRKNKSKRKSRRRGGGDNSLLNNIPKLHVDVQAAAQRRQAEQAAEAALRQDAALRRQAEQAAEAALCQQAEQTRQIQQTQDNKRNVVRQLKIRAETKRILEKAKSLASVKKQTDEEANARKENLRSLFSAYGQ